MKLTRSIILFATSAAVANAATLLNVNFDSGYTDGALDAQNGWSSMSGVNVASGGLSYASGDITINGGSKHASWSNTSNPNTSTGATANIALSSAQSGDVWFSLTMNITATSTADRFWFYVSDDLALNTGSAGAMGQIINNSRALAGGYRVNTAQQTSSSWGTPELDETFFLVGRYSKDGTTGTGYNRMEVWVNPSSTTLGTGIVAQGANYTGATGGIDTFAITALGGSSTVLWDNLLVGTSQADVLDVYVVPEPSTYAMFAGMAMIGIALLKRRRSQQ